MRVRPAAALGCAVLVLQTGCRSKGPRESAALRVEYAGCASVLPGPVCVLKPDRQLVVWIASVTDGPLPPSGARALASPIPIQGGRRQPLEVEHGATRVEVRAGDSMWRLALSTEPGLAWDAEARRLFRSGHAEDARRLVEEQLRSGRKEERGRAAGALARIELGRGRRDEARRLLRQAVADHRERGRVLDLVNDATVLVYTLLFESQRFGEVRGLLASLPDDSSAPAEASYYVAYYRGLLALTTGDLRSALRELADAARRAERLGLTGLQRTAEQVLAEPLQLLGRRGEAETLLDRLRREAPQGLPACDRAQLLNALGWNRLLIREAGQAAPDPLPVLEDAMAALGGGCPHLPDEELNVGLNLALAHLQAKDLKSARARLAAASASKARSLQQVLWQREIEARLDLQEGHAEGALARFEQLDRLAAATLSWGVRWRAAVGRAQALRALGRGPAALAAFAEAEDRLDDDSLQVPIQEGREGLLAGRESATRSHVDLLLAEGRAADALALARRSRARILAALERGERLAALTPEERRAWDEAMSSYRLRRDELAAATAEDWKLPADRLGPLGEQRAATRRELDALLDGAFAMLDRGRRPRAAPRPPAEGELILAYYPLPAGLAGFAKDARSLAAVRLDCAVETSVPAQLGPCLLGPFAERIRAARRVRLLPFGPLGGIDFHALPLGDAPLLAGRPVTWSLDLAAPADSAEGDRPIALLVSDPRGDLAAARREVRSVETKLRAAGKRWRLDVLEADAARYGEVRRLLPGADLFHFAGHAQFTGRGGWDSELPLAGSAALTVGDILALERAPRWAVLAGCETGRSSYEAGESLGLAQALLSRGSSGVVAATRPVADRTTAVLVEGFYHHWSAGLPAAAALQRAQLAIRSADPQADWAAFRLLEP